jgi:hypothetical protein
MSAYDCGDEEIPAVAGSCKYMKFRNPGSGAHEAYGGVSCSMCTNWDGSECRKKVFDSLVSKIDYM